MCILKTKLLQGRPWLGYDTGCNTSYYRRLVSPVLADSSHTRACQVTKQKGGNAVPDTQPGISTSGGIEIGKLH